MKRFIMYDTLPMKKYRYVRTRASISFPVPFCRNHTSIGLLALLLACSRVVWSRGVKGEEGEHKAYRRKDLLHTYLFKKCDLNLLTLRVLPSRTTN